MGSKEKTAAEAYSLDPYKGMPDHPLIVGGEGCWLIDGTGRRYWDGSGGSGAVNLGHQHPAVVEAVKKQTDRLLHVGWNVPHDVRRTLIRKLGAFAPFEDCAILLAVTGTEATEAALKVARAATGRRTVLGFDRSFHGKSTGALGLTWRPAFSAYAAVDRKRHVSVPYPLQGIGKRPSVTPEECLAVLRKTLEHLQSADDLPAAMLLEPIQVSEGIHPAGVAFLREAVELARSYGTVVIFDEIYTGFGRTGAPFHCVKTGIVPDLLLIGKGLGNGIPISGVIGGSPLMNALPPGNHSSTFAANPLSCAAGVAVLDVLEETELWRNADLIGSQLLRYLETRHGADGSISKPRGEGLLIGFDLLDRNGDCCPVRALAFAERAMKKGILLRWGGYSGSTVKITPPLTMNAEELAWVTGTFDALFDSLADEERGL